MVAQGGLNEAGPLLRVSNRMQRSFLKGSFTILAEFQSWRTQQSKQPRLVVRQLNITKSDLFQRTKNERKVISGGCSACLIGCQQNKTPSTDRVDARDL